MNGLVLNPNTAKRLDEFIEQPVHGLLLTGPNGIGKTAVAEHLAAKILSTDESRLKNHQFFMKLTPDNNVISIDAVRSVQHFLELKTIGQASFRRALIIEHAEAMTIEAQNAMLKTLEEPPADTLIILTATTPKVLLPTVTSRLQQLAIQTPNEKDLKDYFKSLSADQLSQFYNMSGGLPGLMAALAEDSADHPMLLAISRAKQILQAKTFERLGFVDELAKSKAELANLFEALIRIADTGLKSSAAGQNLASVERWQKILSAAEQAKISYAANAQAKLLLTNLMLEI